MSAGTDAIEAAQRARAALYDDTTLTGRAWCERCCALTDDWVRAIFEQATGGDTGKLALVAVGGYGRGELSPSSDLDLLLLHDNRRNVGQIAQAVWYPLWDAKVKLGHAVRTVREALQLADDDLETATSLLTVRHLAGEAALTGSLVDKSLAQWRKRSRRWLDELHRTVKERHARAGEVAFLLEPDLKDGRGGLRDIHSLHWAELLQSVILPDDHALLAAAGDVLLGARVELHRRTGKASDVLLLQEQDAVASALGYASADALMAAVSGAARSVAWASDEAWHRIRSTLDGPLSRASAARRDEPLAGGLVLRDREVHLDSSARPADDPALALRAAAAAARHRTRIDRQSLDRLAAETAPMPDPWPVGACDALVDVLLQGRDALTPLEALDQKGLLVRMLPEWAAVRSKPQRNAYHRFTVDRHLLECAANAADLVSRVSRPDLLVLGALFHDLGKGYPGDHTEQGIVLVERIGPRMGLPHDDVAVLVQLVRHHLLLPDVATRRDLSDDATIRHVAEAVGSPLVLELLHALTEADSMATGPAAWGSWKAELVADLVERTAHVVGGGRLADVTWSLFPSPEVLALMGAARTTVRTDGDRLTVVAPDRPGLFSRVAGVLAIHGLDVLAAQAHSDEQGMAASEFKVAVGEGRELSWDRVVADLERALHHQLAIEARLAERARTYRPRRTTTARPAPPKVLVDNNASSNATFVEVHAPNAIGVLYRITRALGDLGLDIRHAKVQTLGDEVVDAFYVRDADGRKVEDRFHLAELERSLLHQIALPAA